MCLTVGDSLQNHRSEVLHILSQLKLGMDLTRVSGFRMEFCTDAWVHKWFWNGVLCTYIRTWVMYLLGFHLLLGVASDFYSWKEIASRNLCWPFLSSWPFPSHQWCSDPWGAEDSSNTVLSHHISCWKKRELIPFNYNCIHKCYFTFQSDVAKKPYNPVLGEVFRCYVDPPGTPSRVPLDQVSEVRWWISLVNCDAIQVLYYITSYPIILLSVWCF